MKVRYSTVAGFLATASLLSGSAFAYAPEFIGDLPTIYITDRTSDVSPSAAPFDTPNGPFGSGPSAYLFRYDNAISAAELGAIVDLNDSTNLADVEFMFTESANVVPVPVVPNLASAGTLEINGVTSFGNIPASGDFTSAPSGKKGQLGTLSFRNIDFSPRGVGAGDGGPFDGVGVVTGNDIKVSLVQERIVTIYINDDDATATNPGARTAESFVVVTQVTNGLGDRSTTPATTDPFASAVNFPGNFNSWVVSDTSRVFPRWPASGTTALGQANSTLVSAANTSGFTRTPAGPAPGAENPAGSGFFGVGTTAVTGSPTSLVVGSNAAQVGYTGWQLPRTLGPSLQANKIYRLRTRLSSASASDYAGFQVRIGDALSHGTANSGLVDIPYVGKASNTPTVRQPASVGTAAVDFDTYLYTKTVATDPKTDIDIKIVDSNGFGALTTSARTLNILRYDLSVADRSAFGAGTVILNYGGTVPTPNATETNVLAVDNRSRVDFTVTGTTPGVTITNNAGENSDVPNSITRAAAQITAQMGPISNGQWERQVIETYLDPAQSLNLDNGQTGINLVPGALYALDIWASSTSAQNPLMFTQINVDATTSFSNSGWFLAGGEPGLQLAATPKFYTTIFSPFSANAEARAQLQVGWYYTFGPLPSSTVTIHRIILTRLN